MSTGYTVRIQSEDHPTPPTDTRDRSSPMELTEDGIMTGIAGCGAPAPSLAPPRGSLLTWITSRLCCGAALDNRSTAAACSGTSVEGWRALLGVRSVTWAIPAGINRCFDCKITFEMLV